MSDEVTRQAAELRADRDAARAEVAIVIEERDAARAERDNWQQRAEVVEQAMQGMAAEIQGLTAERDVARAEAEGLRADLLAHPPEVHQELAIERKRHVELMEDYDRREVVITTLEEALKRAESMLKAAQGQHIDERLKGFLAVISQLADQSQELLP
jgi:uncharacterized coiled-coil DUF342 family protein